MKTSTSIVVLVLTASAFAGNVIFGPFPTNGVVLLSMPPQVSSVDRATIQTDFSRCLDVSRDFLTPGVKDDTPGSCYLGGLWVPDMYPVIVFPKRATRSNEVFTVSLGEDFVSRYRQHAASLAAYTNEIAKMETFIQTLAATNRAAMTDNELLGGLMLYKDASPGTHAIPAFLVPSQRAAALSGTYYMPPLAGFFTINIGPVGQDTYLWSLVPVAGSDGVYTQPAIYYNGRWWLSNWLCERGEQQW